jgi:hypothetical protein
MTMKQPAFLLVLAVHIFLIGTVAAQTGTIGGDMGIYRVHSNVNGAAVYFDGDYQGNIVDNILDVPVYSTATPYRSFTVQKEGYRPYTGAINSVPAKGQIINLYATLSALPLTEYGTIHLTITPTLSSVSYDGQEVGLVPPSGILDLMNIPPGDHIIQVSKEGFVSNTTEVTVGKNENLKLFITLQPLGLTSLSVTSSPSGAVVELDGKTVGMTPIALQNVTPGSHTLHLSIAGFNDYNETIVLTNEGGSIDVNLTPLPITRPGLFGQMPISPLLVILALCGIIFLYHRREP